MASSFRSDEVVFCQLIIPDECAYTVVRNIGELECLQFLDRNIEIPAFSRKFTQNVMWCEDIERKIRFIDEQLKKSNLTPYACTYVNIDATLMSQFNALESEITGVVDNLTQSNNHLAELRKGYNDLIEYRHVLRKSERLSPETDSPILQTGDKNISVMNGIINRNRVSQFEQFLWRACRGNILLRQIPIDEEIHDAESDEKIKKSVFAIYLQGEQLVAKVTKICHAFNTSIFSLPRSTEEKNQTSIGLMTRIKDVEMVLNQTLDQNKVIFSQICKNYNVWKTKIIKIKAIFVTLNLFSYDTGSRTLVAEGWCPVTFIPNVRQTLVDIREAEKSDIPVILNIIHTNRTPPTYYHYNKVLTGFQNLVDAYGFSTYKEVNPAIFMLVTFPFLFAVMFGDFGHALFIVAVGVYFILRENTLAKTKHDEMISMVFGGRYIILFMGLFSLYSGLLYNDVFSKSLFMFKSGWITTSATAHFTTQNLSSCALTNSSVILEPTSMYSKAPYPFGIDPMWSLADNKITFVNSIKMKLSVILGYLQMFFGIVLGAFNHRYFNRNADMLLEFLPQMIFFQAVFGYMIFMIFFKWIFISANSTGAPIPSILIVLIDMFVKFGQDIPPDEYLYPGQKYVQMSLVLIALVCVPWLLCAKPIYIYLQRRKATPIHQTLLPQPNPISHPLSSSNSTENTSSDSHQPPECEQKEMGEIIIMQLIHTIEFTLGCISHLASYLRLWALSLAHNQLSELLWNMVLRLSLTINAYYGSIFIFAICYLFLTLTILILILMEGLSTFLHALRLHWIEFQSKFYVGGGQPLIVFSFKDILENN